MEFVDASRLSFNTIHANNFEFMKRSTTSWNASPWTSSIRTRGLAASIGLQKGKPFDPDPRMRAILEDSVAIGMRRPGRSSCAREIPPPCSTKVSSGTRRS